MLSKTLANKFDNLQEMDKLLEIPKLSELTQEEVESVSKTFQTTRAEGSRPILIQGVYRTRHVQPTLVKSLVFSTEDRESGKDASSYPCSLMFHWQSLSMY